MGPLGHGVATFLGADLMQNLDEVGIDRAVAFPLGAPYTDYSESNRIVAEGLKSLTVETARRLDRKRAVIVYCGDAL